MLRIIISIDDLHTSFLILICNLFIMIATFLGWHVHDFGAIIRQTIDINRRQIQIRGLLRPSQIYAIFIFVIFW